MTDSLSTGVVLLQGGIVVVLAAAVRRGNAAAAVNAAGSLAATLLPAAAELVVRTASGSRLVVGPELALWIAVAGLLHSVGMLGPYDSVGWWDWLTHTVSAALVAALAYAGLVVAARPAAGVAIPGGAVAALTVLATVGLGVLWELVELAARWIGDRYGVEPVLVHYGWRDTATDLVFDALGALAVVLLDLRLFVPVAEQAPAVARALVLGGWVAVAVGTVLLTAVLVADRAPGTGRG